MSEDKHVREALQSVAPHPEVPADLLAGAKRRRARKHRLAFAGTGTAAVVLLAGVMLPRLMPGGAADMASRVEPANAQPELLFGEPAEGNPEDASGGQEDGIASQALNDKAYRVTEGVDVAAEASERLGWEAIINSDGVNRVVSPSSLALSLAMAGEGARGASQASIDEALGLSGDVRSEAYGALRSSLLGYEVPPDAVDLKTPPENPVVHQANRVVTVDAAAEQPFLDRLAGYFGAPLLETTFPQAQAELDAWVKENSGGLIENSGIEVDPLTKVVTQDALLFAAAWQESFDETFPGAFQTPHGPVEAEMMSGETEARYASGKRWEAVRLDYDDALAADVILPAPGLTPQELTAEELTDAREALDDAEPEEIPVAMPLLDVAVKTNLMKALPGVDLSNLDGIIPGGEADQWVQQARLTVMPEGTVGAAVTEMAVRVSSAMPRQGLTVDRPYVFRVLDTRTGWPLFLAAIDNPSAG